MSDTTPRDQLAQIINEHMEADVPESVPDKHEPVDADYAMADAILAAGFRPPARTVSTVEELDALAENTVVIVAGEPHVRTFDFWIEGGYMSPCARSSEEMLRDVGDVFTVLYEPKEDE